MLKKSKINVKSTGSVAVSLQPLATITHAYFQLYMLSKWPCTENPSRNANLLPLRLTLRDVSRLLVDRFGPYFELRARNDPLRTFNLIYGNPGGQNRFRPLVFWWRLFFHPFPLIPSPFPTSSLFSCLLSLVSCLLSLVSCLLSLVSCLL